MRPSKQVSESKSILSSQMLPSDANPMGFVHGGTILKLVDVAAGVTALRHTRKTVVTASLDRIDPFEMRVAVIGFGMMGRQIAQVFAQHGHEVSVTDENPIAVKSGLDEIAHGLYGVESAVAKAKITWEEGAKTLQKVRQAEEVKEPCNNA